MKKRTIFFVILSTCLLLLTPLIPAEQVTLIKKTIDQKFSTFTHSSKEENIPLTTIQNKEQKTSSDIRNVFGFITNFFSNEETQDYSEDNLYLLDLIIIFFLILLIFKGIPNLYQKIITFVGWITNNIFNLVSNLLFVIYNLIIFLGEGIITILLGIGQILIKLIEVIGITILATMGGILSIIVTIIVAIGSAIYIAASLLWKGTETFIGLILDILRLIYEAIFKPNPEIS